MEEHFNSYCVLIDKLKTSYQIDLLDADTGVGKVLAHLTFKNFPQNVENVLMHICESHFPTIPALIVTGGATRRYKTRCRVGGSLFKMTFQILLIVTGWVWRS